MKDLVVLIFAIGMVYVLPLKSKNLEKNVNNPNRLASMHSKGNYHFFDVDETPKSKGKNQISINHQWIPSKGFNGGTNSEDDYDNDGVSNSVDLDDDNDGILDSVETIPEDCLEPLNNSNPVPDYDIAEGNVNYINNGQYSPTSQPTNAPKLNQVGQYLVIDLGEERLPGTEIKFYMWRNTTTNKANRKVRITQLTSSSPGGGTNMMSIKESDFTEYRAEKVYTLQSTTRYIQAKMISRDEDSFRIVEVDIIRCIDGDFDLDGILNTFDLDSDNDGIPDNIEAQTTLGYIAPGTFTDTNSNGVNDVYEGGLTPVNTDGTDDPDYLDLDSDNEGADDTTEADITLSGTVGNNGLDNALESADDHSNPIGTLTSPLDLPDSDGDWDFGGDLDFRDTTQELGNVMITQVYKEQGFKAIELTNFGADNIPAGYVKVAFYEDAGSGFLGGITPTHTYTNTHTLESNQSMLIQSSDTDQPSIHNNPLQVVNSDLNFANGDDVYILSTTTDGTAWTKRYDVIRDFHNRTSYVRTDDVTQGNTTYTASEWVAFKDDGLDPYRPATSGGPERHPHDPLVSEVSDSSADKNQCLGYHRTGATTYTNGGWDNGLPDRSRSIIISEDYNHTGSPLRARQLTVDNNSTLSITDNLLIVTEGVNLVNTNDEIRLIDSGGVNPTGKSQLITTHANSSQTTGNGRLIVDQNSDVSSIYRYNYISSPTSSVGLNSYTFEDVVKDGTLPTASESSPITEITFVGGYDGAATSPISIAEYWIYGFGSSGSWSPRGRNGSIDQGEGVIFKGPGVAQNYTFVGSPNDGTITLNVSASTSYLVGNPYASAINATRFIEDNQDVITGTLYFWEQKQGTDETGQQGHNSANYVGGYAIRNLTMGIAANNIAENETTTGGAGLGDGDYQEPAEYIAIGQGFFVAGNDNGGEVKFKNSQREYILEGDDSVFFRTQSTDDDDNDSNSISALKLGLDYMNHEEGVEMHQQIGIAFKDGLTNAYEPGYDSPAFGLQTTAMYWQFEGDDTPYVIAGVPPISTGTEIPLTIEMAYTGEIKIQLDEIGGIDEIPVLLDKSYVGGYPNWIPYPLHEGAVSLSLEEGIYQDRFFITFIEGALDVEDMGGLSTQGLAVFVDQNRSELVVTNHSDLDLQDIKLYDLLGKELQSWRVADLESEVQNRYKLSGRISRGIYIVQMNTSQGPKGGRLYIDPE